MNTVFFLLLSFVWFIVAGMVVQYLKPPPLWVAIPFAFVACVGIAIGTLLSHWLKSHPP